MDFDKNDLIAKAVRARCRNQRSKPDSRVLSTLMLADSRLEETNSYPRGFCPFGDEVPLVRNEALRELDQKRHCFEGHISSTCPSPSPVHSDYRGPTENREEPTSSYLEY